MKLGFKKAHPDAKIPTYAHPGDAGMDVSSVDDGIVLNPGNRALISTGLIAEIPTGYEIQVRPRSGMAYKKGITVLNGPGTVDSSYIGIIGVLLINHGTDTVVIRKGDRIAQLVLAPVTRCEPVEIAEVPATERGTGGFGSTGR